MRKNIIKLNAIICSIMLLIATFPVSSLAKTVDLKPSTLQTTEDIADRIATASGDTDIVDEYAEDKDIYLVGEENVLYEMPKNGDNPILTTIDDVVIGMSLPKELSLEKATIASDGSFVYLGEDDASVCTQIIKENVHGEDLCFNRTSVVIDNSNASHQYTFAFELPDGFKLCTADDYNRIQAEYYEHNKKELIDSGMSEDEYKARLSELKVSSGEVYIVDKDNEIVEVIGKAWAKDANGYDVETSYEIEDNKLIQNVEFDENSLFPIVADPETHPTKYKYFSLKKANVKTLRDKYASSSRSVIVGYIASVAVTSFSVASVAIASVTFASNLYSVEQHKLWTKVYDGFKKSNNMVKIRVTYTWNGLHKAYAPSNKVKVVSYYKR